MSQRVFFFGDGVVEGGAHDPEILGALGSSLARMAPLGLPVPAGFALAWAADPDSTGDRDVRTPLSGAMWAGALEALARLERVAGARLGDPEAPLVVTVRPSALDPSPFPDSPCITAGVNAAVVAAWSSRSDPGRRFALQAYRRALFAHAVSVERIAPRLLEEPLREARARAGQRLGHDAAERGVPSWRRSVPDAALDVPELEAVVSAYEAVLLREGRPFPGDPREQLRRAIDAIRASAPLACVVQRAVFGDRDDRSAAGRVSTRDPATGERRLAGVWLPRATEDDLRDPVAPALPVSAGAPPADPGAGSLEERLPECHAELQRIARALEHDARDAREIAFAIERGALQLLGAWPAPRTPAASVRIAVDLVREGLVPREEAILRVDAGALDGLLHPAIDPAAPQALLARGLGASPGAACGHVVFDAADALRQAQRGVPVILVRLETSPEDIAGIRASRGVVTTRGGITSHAAVVARGVGRPCIAGVGAIAVNASAQTLTVATQDEAGRTTRTVTLERGAVLTVDGATGAIYAGEVPLVSAALSGELGELLAWADGVRRLRVRANADTAMDARAARTFGAEGIGLCRTEHMFFEDRRLAAMRRVILADGPDARAAALDALLPLHREDFAALLREARGWPTTVRLLDPPLHEFLPRERAAVERAAEGLGVPAAVVVRRVRELTEENPMLGHRGCRLAVTSPEIYATQTRALLEAALLVSGEGLEVRLEILVPFVASAAEFARVRAVVDGAAEAVFAREGRRIAFALGTMIELPRAALLARELARDAAFFSFGTNDLTQATWGLSRDDAAAFLPAYLEAGVLRVDPFAAIDEAGVGALVARAVEHGRAARPDLVAGICGEHGGDPRSIDFFERTGLDYVSCSPYRVPAARLAAAQAVLRGSGRGGRTDLAPERHVAADRSHGLS